MDRKPGPDCQVRFAPQNIRVTCPPGTTLLEAARRAGIPILSICGGEGVCGRCLVRVIEGAVTPITADEREQLSEGQIAAGSRLACLTELAGDAVIAVPAASLQATMRLEIEGVAVPVPFDPVVTEHMVELSAPAPDGPFSAWGRLDAVLRDRGICEDAWPDPGLAERLPLLLPRDAGRVRVSLHDQEVIDVRPPDAPPFGLAVDLGTTKLAAYLVDMETGLTVATAGEANPQQSFGADVMSRISYAMTTKDGGATLHRVVLEGIHGLIRQLGAPSERIVDAVVVGNTAMHHLFLGLPVAQLGLAPYLPAVTAPVDVKARSVGLQIAGGAYVHLLPNIAGFVGGDHVAMILATGIDQVAGPVLGLDIGTNTEVVLAQGGRLTCCSTASGPAFEGGRIRFGVRAIPGAIEQVRLVRNQAEVKTIGAAPAAGICGSGIVDAISELRRVGLLDSRGRLQPGPGVRTEAGMRVFVLVPAEESATGEDITLSQGDIAEILLAKAAIRTGVGALLDDAHLAAGDLAQVVLAGAFGTRINPASAMGIGMLPPLPLDRFLQVGNAAGAGARLALVSKTQRRRAEEIARRAGHLDLMLLPDFADRYADSLYLP